MFAIKITPFSVAFLVTLAACGGSQPGPSGGPGLSASGGPEPFTSGASGPAPAGGSVPGAVGFGTPAAPPPASSSGVAVVGYLKDANALCVTSKASVKTAATGIYTFTPACDGAVVVTGGSDVDTGFAFAGALKTPAGGSVASPLSTLMADLAAAQHATLLSALGLPAGTDLSKTDPADGRHFALLKTNLAVQQIVQQLATTLAALLNQPDTTAMYTTVAAALSAELLASAAPLFDANGSVNQVPLGAVAARVAAAAGATIHGVDLDAMAKQIALQAQQFSSASSADELARLAKTLQDPAAKPIDTSAASTFLAIADDTISLNGGNGKAGIQVPLATFAAGVTTDSLSSIGIPLDVSRAPAIDTSAAIFFELAESGGANGRTLQVMIDKVAVKLANGALSVEPGDDATLYVYLGSAGGDLNITMKDLGFKPLTARDNKINLNFEAMLGKALAGAGRQGGAVAAQFGKLSGNFTTKIVVTKLNLRSDANGAPLDTMRAQVHGTPATMAIVGRGIAGKLTVQPR